MFEPVLKHHREEFERLKRQQLAVTVGGGGVVLMLLIIIGTTAPTAWIPYLIVPLGGGLFAAIVIFEARKTAVFRRDLREQRERKGDTS